ncbi:MAG: aspartate aminotransferase family protein, partial [Propionibacteriaceae bacterium]
ATLRLLDAEVYARLNTNAARVAGMATAALTDAGVPHTLNRAGNLFSIFFTANPVYDYASAKTQDTAAFARFFHAMLDAGVWLPPSAYEAWFVSAAHGDAELSTIEAALVVAAKAARG